MKMTRRDFLKTAMAGVATVLFDPCIASAELLPGTMPMRALGSTGEKVSLLGMGGFHIGLDATTEDQAVSLVRAALDGGVTFLDNSREYQGGLCEERMGKALQNGYRAKAFLMTKNCGHARDGESAKKSLEESLKALKTDYLDLWMFHEVIYDNDPDWIFTRGSLEVALQAKKEGKVRFIGFSGHKLPDIFLDMLARPAPWDVV
ncbi:MAG TPA: aldo/keto reductase, partial [Candidatus Ozemobacteraceae bacterium]|nr:aldo/keto reductase [Candidatus Ozemobacteraceae bacterium]